MLNGEWGIGKTHFINDLLFSIKNGIIKPKIIKQFVYIDAWKYLSSNNLVNDFIVELAEQISNSSKHNWRRTKKIIKLISNYLIIPNINKRFGLAIPNIKTKENYIKNINNKIKKVTLIIIDNIERLGSNSCEIIRVIQKLSISDKFIFLLSINLEKIDSNWTNYELNIDKYINIPYYNLSVHGYKNVLLSYNVPEKYLSDINSMLLIKNKNSKTLTMRELENLIIKYGLRKDVNLNKSKYWYLSLFSEIWKPKEKEGNFFTTYSYNPKIKEIINKDIYLFSNEYISKLQVINNKYLDFLDETKFIKFYPYSQNSNDPEYRFLSIKMVDYLNELISSLELLRIKRKNLQSDINKDIVTIKEVMNNINNDIDLQKINLIQNEVYMGFVNYSKDSGFDINAYNTTYFESIFYRLENDFKLNNSSHKY